MVGDCPGYKDNRHPILNIANMLNMVNIMKAVEKKSILIAVDIANFTADRGESFKGLQNIIVDFFGGKDNLEKNSKALRIAITKWEPTLQFNTF